MEINIRDYAYLAPPQEVFEVTHEPRYIQYGEGVKSVRKVFDCVPYTDFEKEKLKEFEAMIEKERLEFPAGWTTAYTMKYIYSSKFALDKSMENLKSYLGWLASPNRTKISTKSLNILKEGLIYMAGRDKQFRPVVVVSVDKIDLKKMEIDDFIDALSALLFIVEKNCFVPGKVENWILIIETNGAGVWNFPFKVIQTIVSVTSVNFTSTLDQLYIMNPSRLLKGSWSVIQNFLHPETAAKIAMIDKSDYNKLLEKISIDQVEERYGGKLSQPTSYWPPKTTLTKAPYTKTEGKSTTKHREIDLTKEESLPKISRQIKLNPVSITPKPQPEEIYYDFDQIYLDIPGLTSFTTPQKVGKEHFLKVQYDEYGMPTNVTMASSGKKKPVSKIYDQTYIEKQAAESGCYRATSGRCNIF